jgi:hypothetical protein
MDPLSSIGLSAGVVQFVDVGGRALLEVMKLLRDLRDTPEIMRGLLKEAENSIAHIYVVKEAIEAHSSVANDHLNDTQVGIVNSKVRDAYDAISEVKNMLARYSHDLHSTPNKWRKLWNSVVSVTERSSLEQKLRKVLRANQELQRALQVVQLEIQGTMM